jgi:hypothetical protein
MPKKQKRVAWSAAQVRTLKSMAKNEDARLENRQSSQAHRGRNAAESVQLGTLARYSRLIYFSSRTHKIIAGDAANYPRKDFIYLRSVPRS